MAKKYLFVIFATFALIFSFASAEISPSDIVLGISPEDPRPSENIKATLSSRALNLDRVNISWFLDGQKMSGGIGQKTFYFKLGNSGSSTILSGVIDTIEGKSITKTIAISASDVDLLWEADDSYSPPFYKGKTLVSRQGKYKVVAMPSVSAGNKKTNPNNLSYAWSVDGNIRANSSGWGKNYIIFSNSYLDKENVVEVKVSDIYGASGGSRKITLAPTSPKIVFYEYDKSLGIKWEESVKDSLFINEGGKIIKAEPYFFSPKNIESSELAFDWRLNTEKVKPQYPKNVLSIKPAEGKSGGASIEIEINNKSTLFQKLKKSIGVNF